MRTTQPKWDLWRTFYTKLFRNKQLNNKDKNSTKSEFSDDYFILK